jgi:formylglycine-generating enzyme required for sulfatase activity
MSSHDIIGRRSLCLLALCLVAGLTGAVLDSGAAPAPVYRAKSREITNSIGMKLVRIPSGEFVMGSPEEDKESHADERPRHEVRITKAFYLGVHEVTQKEFRAVMGYNPSYFSRDGEGKKDEGYLAFNCPTGGKAELRAKDAPDNFPVENVSWAEAKEYCEKLSAMTKEMESGRVYRLPSEAEWEYACRAGASSYKKFHFGNAITSGDANFHNNLKRTCQVGSFKANAFGLHDMHGNVCEWCGDLYDENYYAVSSSEDPLGPKEDDDWVSRGGSWTDSGAICRSARRSVLPGSRSYDQGFRVLLVLPRK